MAICPVYSQSSKDVRIKLKRFTFKEAKVVSGLKNRRRKSVEMIQLSKLNMVIAKEL